MSWTRVTERLPLVVFLGVFLVTCYVGTLGLLFSPQFRTAYVVFSGAQVPDVSPRNVVLALLLLHAGPLLAWIGYELVMRFKAPARSVAIDDALAPRWLPRLVLLTCASVAVVSLARADAWTSLIAWIDYNQYVHARLRLFDRLTFFEFVNLYTLLPLAGAYVVLSETRWSTRVITLAIVFGLQYPLAQRKVLLISGLLIATAVYLYRHAGRAPRRAFLARHHVRWLAGGPLVLYLAYVGLTLITVLGANSGAFQNLNPDAARGSRLKIPDLGDTAAVSFRLDEGAIARIQRNRVLAVTLYVLLSPMTRTSVAAVAYPVIFPDVRPYYRLDLGQDVLGFGSMPDDNLLVYSVLWPEHERGAIGAPFHISLYAQGGLWLSCLGSLVVGVGLALAWRPLSAVNQPTALGSIYGAVVIVLAAFLAIDSIRNSLIVSYGMAWGLVALVVLSGVARQLSRIDPVPAAVVR